MRPREGRALAQGHTEHSFLSEWNRQQTRKHKESRETSGLAPQLTDLLKGAEGAGDLESPPILECSGLCQSHVVEEGRIRGFGFLRQSDVSPACVLQDSAWHDVSNCLLNERVSILPMEESLWVLATSPP